VTITMDIKRPRMISMNRAAAMWSKITGTPRPHRATMLRWAIKGVKGARLRAERLGGRWYSTHEAVIDFHRQLTTATAAQSDHAAGPSRIAQIQASLTELDRLIGQA
jgi:hypothetical protein